MCRTDSRPRRPDGWRTLGLLSLCLGVFALHFLADCVLHFDAWVGTPYLAEAGHSHSPQDHPEEEHFVLPGRSVAAGGGTWSVSGPALPLAPASADLAPSLPPPRR